MAKTKTIKSVNEGGILISHVHQLGGRLFAKILTKHGIKELNPAQGRIIYELWKEDSISQSILSTRTRLDKSTLTLMLKRLERAGHLRRESSPNDKRLQVIRLTAKNRELHSKYNAASQTMNKLFYKKISAATITNFEKTLKIIIGNLEEALSDSI